MSDPLDCTLVESHPAQGEDNDVLHLQLRWLLSTECRPSQPAIAAAERPAEHKFEVAARIMSFACFSFEP